MDYLLGIDVGSSFVKAALFDEAGRACGSAHFANHPTQPQPGVAEYDGEAMLHAILAALRDLLAQAEVDAGQIAALALDGMQSGVLGVDARGLPATPYTTTLDTRFTPYLDRVMAAHEESIRRTSGAAQPCYAPKVQWVRAEFPGAYARTFRFMTVGDYLTCRLTGRVGEELFFGSTYLWMTGISDTRRSAWSGELCAALEIAPEILPPIVPASAVVGGVTPETAAVTGLRAGTPVVAGCGDQMAGFLGAGITRPGRVGDVAGTYPVLAFCTDRFRPDLTYRRSEILPSTIGGLYNPISFINGGGLTHHWFLDQFGGGAGEPGFALLDAQAAAVPPGAEGLLFNPHLGGRACPTDTRLRGGWLGFTWAHTRAHFYRALLEAVAYDHAEALRTLRAAYPEHPVAEVRVFGGGARSDLWNQIKADVLGVPYLRLERDDIGTLGAALLAGYGVGLVGAPAEAAEAFTRASRRYDPGPDAHAAYQPYVAAYTGMLRDLEPAYTRLASLPRP
jgi:xylulokinase